MGLDDLTADGPQSWDGRKTADFAKVSNDGLWTWDGSEWTPRKKEVIQASNDQLSHHANAKSDERISTMVPIHKQQTAKEVVSIEAGSISPDGYHQWDGGKWIPVQLTKLSDDGVWMWNGKEWIPNPNRAVDKKEPAQSQFQQMQNTQVAQYPGYDQNAQMLLIQQTNKSKSGLWIALVIVLPILFVAFTVVMAGVLYVWASALAEGTGETIESDGNIIQQDYPSWEKFATISSMRDSAIFFADFTAEGEMIATFANSGPYSVIEFWNITDQTRITEISLESRIYGGALSPTENNMVTYSSGVMQVWNLENFTLEKTIEVEEDVENCMKFSDDGAFLITAHEDWIISVWNTTDYSMVFSFDYGGQIYDADISPENDFLAVGGYKRDVKIWNLGTSELEATLSQPEAWVVGVDFSPNGVYLASSSSSLGLGGASELFVWETSDWSVHSSLADEENRVFGLEFSPDSEFLSTTWDSNAAFFYDVRTNDLVQTLPIGPFGFGGGVNNGDILHNVFENQILVIDEGGINIQMLVRLD